LDLNASGENTSGDSCRQIAEGWVDIATDAMCFFVNQMGADPGFQQAVLACDDSAELQAVQAAFLSEAIHAYSTETRAAAHAMQALLSRWPVVPVQ